MLQTRSISERANYITSMDWEKLLNNNRLRQSKWKHPEDARNDFDSDFGRIVFSPALRRMHDKTQVFPLTTDDNIHSRLTHSLEVMSVGYSLGTRICESKVLSERIGKETYSLFREIPTLIKNLCLVHDIGNPPFGHFGETAIQEFFLKFFDGVGKCLGLTEGQKNDFLNFDGNAQGLRVLTKLQMLNDAYGLNLTFATLGAYIKYPNYKKPVKKSHIEVSKVGVFVSEQPYFDTIVAECGLKVDDRVVRHPLCYLMEAADSICYLSMDIEDGYNMGLLDLNYLYNRLKNVPRIREKIEEIYNDVDGYYKNDLTKVVNFRIQVIQALVLLASSNFEKNIQAIESGTYNKELIDDDPDGLAEILSDICIERVFCYRGINSLEITGDSVLGGLLKAYTDLVFHKNDKYVRRAERLISRSLLNAAFAEEGLDEKASLKDLSDYYKLKVIVDFVSGMTDQYALEHYQKLSGQKII